MTMMFIVLAGWVAARLGPALLASLIATFAALVVVHQSRNSARRLIEAGPRRATWDRPSRADRKLLAGGLHATMNVVSLTSLLPMAVLRANRLIEAMGR